MSGNAEKVVRQALLLPREQRAYVAEKLLESLDFEEPFKVSSKWKNEILRRCKNLDRGEVELISGDQVLLEASKRFD